MVSFNSNENLWAWCCYYCIYSNAETRLKEIAQSFPARKFQNMKPISLMSTALSSLCIVLPPTVSSCPREELFWWQVLTMNFCGIIKIFLPSSDWCLPFPPPPYFLIEEECPKYLLVVISSSLRGQHLITLAFVFTKKVITLLPFMSH